MIALAVADLVTGTACSHLRFNNYPVRKRGQLVGRSIMVRVASAAAVGALVGGFPQTRYPSLADGRGTRPRGLVGAGTVSPPNPLRAPAIGASDNSATRRRLDLLKTDPILRNTLASWMFMGMANLMTIPLRVEYLGNEKYGINADAAKVALLTVTIPAVVRLFFTPVFGWIFDRMNFFGLRISINLAFGLSIGLFFASSSDVGLVVASVAFGVGIAGGDVLWSLWATKFAPADQVADYMSLHTFSTGLRAVSAPFIGFWLVDSFPARTVGIVCMLMTVIGSVVIVPDMLRTLQRRMAPVDHRPTG